MPNQTLASWLLILSQLKEVVVASENQTIVALHKELQMLIRDLSAIMAGEAGSRFAKGDKAKLKDRIAALEIVLAKLDDAEAQKT